MGRYRKPEYYDKIFQLKKYNCRYRDSVYYEMWRKVLKYVDYEDEILEIGCGTGQFAQMLIDSGKYATYHGIDFSEVAIEKSRERCGKYFGLHDARKPLSVDYNTVICLETLEHIDNDILVLRNIKSGTKFIGSVPIKNDPAHVRVFKELITIKDRYGALMTIDEIIQIDTKFVFKGIMK